MEVIEKIEYNYQEQKSNLEKLGIVNFPYWQNIKKLKLEDLKLFYEFEKKGYYDYKNIILLDQTKFNKKAQIYVNSLVTKRQFKNDYCLESDQRKTKI